MRKQQKTKDELRQKKVLATLVGEPLCEGVRDFELYRHAPDELGVNWSVKLKNGDVEGNCYARIGSIVAMLAKAYDLAD